MSAMFGTNNHVLSGLFEIIMVFAQRTLSDASLFCSFRAPKKNHVRAMEFSVIFPFLTLTTIIISFHLLLRRAEFYPQI